MVIKFTHNDGGNPPGKLADAELHFTESPLDGLKLIGFGIWARRTGSGQQRHVPGPAVFSERGAPELRTPAAGGRFHRSGTAAGPHPRRLRGIRGCGQAEAIDQ